MPGEINLTTLVDGHFVTADIFSPQASSYEIRIDVYSDANLFNLVDQAYVDITNTYSHTFGLDFNTTYYLKAFGNIGGEESFVVTVVTGPATTPTINLAVNVSGNSVTAEVDTAWETSDYFRINVYSDPELTTLVTYALVDVTHPAETFTLAENTTYYFKAFNDDGTQESEVRIATTGGGTPPPQLAAPVITITQVGDTFINLHLDPVANGFNYIVQRSTDPNFTTTVDIYQGPAPQDISETGLTKNVTYYYRALAIGYNAYLASAWSATVSATTVNSLDAPVLAYVCSKGILLNITGVTNGENYQVERSETNDFATVIVIYTGPAGKVKDSTAQVGVHYYYRAKAIATGVFTDSAYSNIVSASINNDVNNQYRFLLTDSKGTWEAHPLGENDITLDWSKPDDGRFDYVLKISGKLQFVGEDYRRLLEMENGSNRCQKILVQIMECSTLVTTGELSLSSGTWDLDKCVYEVSFDKPEKESFIKNTEDVNLFQLIQSRQTVNTLPLGGGSTNNDQIENYIYDYQTINFDDPERWIPPAGSGPLYAQPENAGYVMSDRTLVNFPQPAEYIVRHYVAYEGSRSNVDRDGNCRGNITRDYTYSWNRWINYIPPADPVPTGYIDLNEFRTSDGFRKIARLPGVTEFTSGTFEGTDCTTVFVRHRYVIGLQDSSTNINIDNGLRLQDMFDALLAPYNVSVKSNFFNINSTDATTGNTNPVTGRPTTTANIIFFQKSDVKRYDAAHGGGNNATIFKLSLKNLLKWLVESFNIRWGMVGRELVIEHVSFFESLSPLDLTVDPYLKFIKGFRRYSYAVDSIPGKETFLFMDKRPDVAGENDFNGLPIFYNSPCLSDESKKQEVSHSADKVTTDLRYVLDNWNRDVISDDGFVMLACNKDSEGNYHVMQAGRILSPASQLNNVFGWSHLHNDFWKFDRYMNVGVMNNNQETFTDPKPTKKGEKLNVVYCEDFDPKREVITELGTGTVDSAKYKLSTKTLELQINYP